MDKGDERRPIRREVIERRDYDEEGPPNYGGPLTFERRAVLQACLQAARYWAKKGQGVGGSGWAAFHSIAFNTRRSTEGWS